MSYLVIEWESEDDPYILNRNRSLEAARKIEGSDTQIVNSQVSEAIFGRDDVIAIVNKYLDSNEEDIEKEIDNYLNNEFKKKYDE